MSFQSNYVRPMLLWCSILLVLLSAALTEAVIYGFTDNQPLCFYEQADTDDKFFIVHYNFLQDYVEWNKRNVQALREVQAEGKIQLELKIFGLSDTAKDQAVIDKIKDPALRQRRRRDLKKRSRKDKPVYTEVFESDPIYSKPVEAPSTEEPQAPEEPGAAGASVEAAKGAMEVFIPIPEEALYTEYKFCFSILAPSGLVTLNKKNIPQHLQKRLYIDLHVEDPRTPQYVNLQRNASNRFGEEEMNDKINNNANRLNLRKEEGTYVSLKGPQLVEYQVQQFTNEHGEQQERLVSPEYLKKLEFQLKSIGDAMSEVINSSMTIKLYNANARATMESTFTRVWVCGVLVLTSLVVLTWGQYTYLRRTIRRKRLL